MPSSPTHEIYQEWLQMKRDENQAKRSARIPPPVVGCEHCDAGFLWHEDGDKVVVMICECQR